MLNLSFSSAFLKMMAGDYQLNAEAAACARSANQNMDTYPELRLEQVYTFELWAKLKRMGLMTHDFDNKRVLDLCCGTGYVSWHLLKTICMRQLTLLDISKAELARAETLIGPIAESRQMDVTYRCGDFLSEVDLPQFDIVIGNSFLHHFYDLPEALRKIKRLVTAGGKFIVLHEPTPAAFALETAKLKAYRKYLLKGQGAFEEFRFKDQGIEPGGGADVWVFTPHEMKTLLQNAGFSSVTTTPWHLLRPLAICRNHMHLTPDNPQLTAIQRRQLYRAIRIDSLLNRLLPESMFASFSCLGQI